MAFPNSADFSFVMSLDAVPQAIGSAGAKRVGGGLYATQRWQLIVAIMYIWLAVLGNPFLFFLSCTRTNSIQTLQAVFISLDSQGSQYLTNGVVPIKILNLHRVTVCTF